MTTNLTLHTVLSRRFLSSVKSAGWYSNASIMEINVQPFHPQQDWHGDLNECLASLLPRSLLRNQRRPVLTTTIVQWGEDGNLVRVLITTAEDPNSDDFMQQLRTALSGGKVRCNDTLEMYLPDMIRDVEASMSGQNWLLAAICIIAFFVIVFSALLFIHCKQRRIVIRKTKPTSRTQTPMIHVVMEPPIQRNPLYQVKRPSPEIPVVNFDYPAPISTPPVHPAVDRGKQSTANQAKPTACRTVVFEAKTAVIPSVSGTVKQCQLEHVISDPVPPDSYAALMDDYRNGRPMTVRAVKQKNLFKRQMKKEVPEPVNRLHDPSPV